ncbi:hypothetical protein PI125_g22643 [Phytophthora idaei]|nr:hypothetical protein PI125_g22643 [Phytophthora idaei]
MRWHRVGRRRLDDSEWRSHRTRSVRLKAQQQIKLTLQLSNLTLKVGDPVLKGTRCLEPVHPTVHLFEIFRQAGVRGVRIVNEGAQRANTLLQHNHIVMAHSARVQARLVLRRLCWTSMVSSTITWNALWRGVIARVVPNIL